MMILEIRVILFEYLMIVPDQKVTVGALSEVILRWWKDLECSLEH